MTKQFEFMQQVPLVSVIISFLNEEVFLAESIESVISQTYSNWEIILVDDGSADNSTAIAKKYALAYSGKIIYTDHPEHSNRGLSYSRNYGISHSRGDLIAILDADDVWLEDKLKLQVELMTENPKAEMLCEASAYWYYPWETHNTNLKIIHIGRERDRLFQPLELVKHLYPLSDGDAPCPSGIMIRRNSLLKHGGFEAHFTGKFQLYEDQALLHKIYLNEYVYISSACNNLYRQREGSLVHAITKEGEYHNVRKYFLEWLDKYIEQNDIGDKEIQNLLRKALLPYRQSEIHTVRNLGLRILNKIKKYKLHFSNVLHSSD
jgi:glycosyltransferase involved in cell wall biosynthesis